MQSKKMLITLACVLVASAVLSACAAPTPTADPMLKITQIAGTIQADLTQAAALTPSATPTLAATATPTMLPPTETPNGPTSTPTLTPYPTTNPSASINDSKFIADVTIPDGSMIEHNDPFVKTWRFHNVGKTTWTTGYKFVFVDGSTSLIGAKGIYYIFLPNAVEPNGYIDISVNFIAPAKIGTYTSYWRLFTDQGVPFGDTVRVVIEVVDR